MSIQNPPLLDFALSGRHGVNGDPGSAGFTGAKDCQGGPGTDGKKGEPGENGQDLALKLESDAKAGQVWVHVNSDIKPLPLGDGDAWIRIDLSGGNGGSGGHGGKGGHGGVGHRGQNATRCHNGGDGAPGKNGGPGGKGGDAGDGGSAGNLSIHLDHSDTDLLLLCPQPNLKGGKPGAPGIGGKGGAGGAGGRGGLEHRWTTHTHYTTYTGSGISRHAVHHTMSHHHRNPGGNPGAPGKTGSSGSDGSIAAPGTDGYYQILVNHDGYEERYDYPYELEVSKSDLRELNGDGVFEPGMLFEAHLALRNRGLMPSPEQRTLSSQIQDHGAFEPVEGDHWDTSIMPGEEVTLQKPLRGRIKELDDVPVGSPFDQIHPVYYRTVMSRVNRPCPVVDQQFSNIRVRYPVQMDPIASVSCLSHLDEVPLVLKVQNISSMALGQQAGARSIEVELTSSLPIKFRDLSGRVRDLQLGHRMEIPQLGADASQCLMGTLSIPQGILPEFERIQLKAQLILGDKPIHIRKHEIQVTAPYERDEESDLLLVANSQTSREELLHWRGMAADLGFKKVSVWNISKYRSVNFYEKKKDGTSLLEDFGNKVVVFLNDDGIGENALKQANIGSFLIGAAEGGMRTYFTGSKKTQLDQITMPHDRVARVPQASEKDFPDYIHPWLLLENHESANYWCSSVPDLKDLEKKANKKLKRLEEQYPGRCFHVIHDYHPTMKEKFLRSSGSLGTLAVQEWIPRREILWISEPAPSQHHARNLLQLLPFEEKLARWDQLDEASHEMLRDAILWELIHELKVLQARLGITRSQAAKDLVCLKKWKAFAKDRPPERDVKPIQRLSYALQEFVEEYVDPSGVGPCGLCRGSVEKAALSQLKLVKKSLAIAKEDRQELLDEGRKDCRREMQRSFASNALLVGSMMSFRSFQRKFPNRDPQPFVENEYEFSDESERLAMLNDFAARV